MTVPVLSVEIFLQDKDTMGPPLFVTPVEYSSEELLHQNKLSTALVTITVRLTNRQEIIAKVADMTSVSQVECYLAWSTQ